MFVTRYGMVVRLDGGWRLADAEPAREVHLREVDREELQDHAQGQGPYLLIHIQLPCR